MEKAPCVGSAFFDSTTAFPLSKGFFDFSLAQSAAMEYTDSMNRILYYIQNPIELLYILPAVLLGLTLHEWAHAYAAYRLGDPTARNLGRMSLNPLAHFDPLGLLCMLLLGFGWAKPVPVNPRNFKNYRRDDIIVSLAGVLMNACIVVIFSLLFVGLAKWNYTLLLNNAFVNIFLNIICLNTCLCVFNLIPIPPLDGSHVLENLLGRRYPHKLWNFLHRYGQYVLIALLCLDVLDYPLSWAQNLVLNWIYSMLL